MGPLHLPALRRSFRDHDLKTDYLILPDGERHKTLETVRTAYDWLLQRNADRQVVLVLLGGGVLGDVGGLVAATFLRGVHYVQVPTTLVAQVDSSVGGKVGVDHKEGKNLIGAFYQPDYVHCDVGYLETLPEREYLCGLAEVIKYALIADADFFDFLQKQRIEILRREPEPLKQIVQACCAIKANVVMEDEKEVSGRRMILNFGHTVGHAIEQLTSYEKFNHGEAVAIGMVAAARLSAQLGYCSETVAQEVSDIVAAYGLPIQQPRYPRRRWEKSIQRDKKVRGDQVHFVFLKGIGTVKVAPTPVSDIATLLLS